MTSLASIALAIPTIASCVLSHLVRDVLNAPENIDWISAHYPVLRRASLVCRAWVKPTRQLLFFCLDFHAGTKQLQRWLDAVGPGPAPYPSPEVHFGDPEPPEEVSADKWDFEVVKKVFQKVEGVKVMALYFDDRQKELPAELLLNDGLKGLKSLRIDNPLSMPPTIATSPFQHLKGLVALDRDPNLARDWSRTLSFLSVTQAGSHSPPLHTLDLRFLPSFAEYLFPTLMPVAASLCFLELPSLDSTPHLWRLMSFVQDCRHLQSLMFETLTPASSVGLKLLASSLLPGLLQLRVRRVYGSLGGHHDLLPGAANRDTWTALLQLVSSLPDLKDLQIGYARFLYLKHKKELPKLAREKGFRVTILSIDNSRSAEEEEMIIHIIQSSIIWSRRPNEGEPSQATQGETEEGVKADEQEADVNAL
ncbi:hypothetical protein JCM1840_007271 [Sporobolomyces johnsonii]